MKKGIDIKVLLMILIPIILLLVYFSVPKITIIGSDITIPLDSSYIEEGYSIKTMGIDISNIAKIDNNIDTSRVGNYEVIYKIKYLFFTIKKIRRVSVIETIPPVITLYGDVDTYICPNGKYIEEGYDASDNYDGDIKDLVKVSINDSNIIYEVYDTSLNYASVKRNLIYLDNEKPDIKLNGGNVILKVGDSYSEPGYTAYDNCLGDITKEVNVKSNVDTSRVGNYEVIYTLTDGSNETIVKRQVFVSDGVLGLDNAPGVIYLTFDDGPSIYTHILLETLNKYGVKATFFLVPKNDSLYYLIKQEYDAGHSIGIHSMSHTYSSIYSSDEMLYNDISRTNDVIKNITGEYTYLYRYPGGSSNTVSKWYSNGIISRSSSKLHQLGYHYFDWNISSGDADGRSHASWEIARNVINRLSKDRVNVVLMHDTKDFSCYAVESIIEYALANGYTFAPITMNTHEVHHSIAN